MTHTLTFTSYSLFSIKCHKYQWNFTALSQSPLIGIMGRLGVMSNKKAPKREGRGRSKSRQCERRSDALLASIPESWVL